MSKGIQQANSILKYINIKISAKESNHIKTYSFQDADLSEIKNLLQIIELIK
jgi:hypothetical protein